MKETADYEKTLMAHLSDNRLDKASLKKYSTIIATLRKYDVIIDRIWKYGIPYPDGVVVRGRLGAKDLVKLKDVFKIPEIYGIEIFPLGIPFPDLLDVRFKLGEQFSK